MRHTAISSAADICSTTESQKSTSSKEISSTALSMNCSANLRGGCRTRAISSGDIQRFIISLMHWFISTSNPLPSQKQDLTKQGIHVMTKVRYSLAASLNCKFVIALVQRRSLLEEGCSLNMCAQNCLPLFKHSSFAVTNLFGSQFSYLHKQHIHISAQVHLQGPLPPRCSHG